MLEFAIRVAGSNTALDQGLSYAQTHSKLGPVVTVLMDSQAFFCGEVMRLRGWEWNKLLECIADIGRAAQLAQHSRRGQALLLGADGKPVKH